MTLTLTLTLTLSEALDDARRNVTLRAAALAAASTVDPIKFAPSRYPLFLAQFTDIDTQVRARLRDRLRIRVSSP